MESVANTDRVPSGDLRTRGHVLSWHEVTRSKTKGLFWNNVVAGKVVSVVTWLLIPPSAGCGSPKIVALWGCTGSFSEERQGI
jgi:hypothetical protein